jgi:subtilisin family serine protease
VKTTTTVVYVSEHMTRAHPMSDSARPWRTRATNVLPNSDGAGQEAGADAGAIDTGASSAPSGEFGYRYVVLHDAVTALQSDPARVAAAVAAGMVLSVSAAGIATTEGDERTLVWLRWWYE